MPECKIVANLNMQVPRGLAGSTEESYVSSSSSYEHATLEPRY